MRSPFPEPQPLEVSEMVQSLCGPVEQHIAKRGLLAGQVQDQLGWNQRSGDKGEIEAVETRGIVPHWRSSLAP